MTNSAHLLETALLVFAAYLLGCVAGYCAHRILYATRGTRKAPRAVEAAIASSAPLPARQRTSAARLAAAVSRDEVPMPVAKAPEPAKAKSPPRKAKPRTSPKPADPKPVGLSEPRHGQADNLKQIKGIGPKIEASLNALGIFHIDQIAGWNKANVDWVDSRLAFKGRIRRERWVEQALELSKVKA